MSFKINTAEKMYERLKHCAGCRFLIILFGGKCVNTQQ